MDKKKILLISLLVLAVIVLIISFVKFSANKDKNENKLQDDANSEIIDEAEIDRTVSTSSVKKFDPKEFVITTTSVKTVTDKQLETLAPEKKEEVLNMRVANPENIEKVTGIKAGEKTEQAPIIENGIIVGVPTGGQAVVPATNASTPSSGGTGSVAPVTTYQDEFDAIRNQKK